MIPMVSSGESSKGSSFLGLFRLDLSFCLKFLLDNVFFFDILAAECDGSTEGPAELLMLSSRTSRATW